MLDIRDGVRERAFSGLTLCGENKTRGKENASNVHCARSLFVVSLKLVNCATKFHLAISAL